MRSLDPEPGQDSEEIHGGLLIGSVQANDLAAADLAANELAAADLT